MKKWLTYQEYNKKIDSFQDAYNLYYEQNEIIEELISRSNRLNNIINKAIEYIEEIWKECEHTNIYNITLIGILRACLLKILRGEDNE